MQTKEHIMDIKATRRRQVREAMADIRRIAGDAAPGLDPDTGPVYHYNKTFMRPTVGQDI
ncbi:hypothetical protein GCM10023144_03170 [Pigmentiphaga soli]|uniref:Uncharacterized protein n=1 Tax=Pigmentiphaga soli TaxID=1007095 RepID=A0ABP8GEE7_9BURK